VSRRSTHPTRYALDAELTKRVARGLADSTEIIVEHFRGCGFAPARASSTAAALVAALEGARTIARLERTLYLRRWRTLAAKGAQHQNGGMVRRRDKLMSAPGSLLTSSA
jgi:hypothetical protein